MVRTAGPSGAVKVKVPLVNSLLLAASEPAARPASSTCVVSPPATGRSSVTGLSAIEMTSVAVEVSPSSSVMT